MLLYDDQNGDSLHQDTEPALAGGAVSLTNQDGSYTKSEPTQGGLSSTDYMGICFTDVPPGSYTVSVGIPDNYNPTSRIVAMSFCEPRS